MRNKKVAVITGGTSGIGLGTAALFLKKGYDVALIGRSREKGREAVRYLAADGLRGTFFPGDVSSPGQCQTVIADIVARYGRIDVLVNSAGIYLEKAIREMTEAEYVEVMDINVKGTYFMCKYVVPELCKTTGGAIINVASDAGLQGNRLCSAYCASKGAVTLFTKALALELSGYPIRVNCVCPGDIDTPLTRRQLLGWNDPEAGLNEMKKIYPLNRIGFVREVAEVICFLASDAASFVTGAAWPIDGGLTTQ
ncbi:MAG TPA: SDR family NAD(P)-dependent oxidoreductase [Patescibacteria group bacterium]|nr:SDR family NAD(P)-dependent oxidoreductase [Patescibacteria group bacterium]